MNSGGNETGLSVGLATNAEDVDAVRELCREFVAWQLEEFPAMRAEITAYFEPSVWESTLADLPNIHARPRGAMLLARLDGKPCGCIMYHEAEPGTAEIKRLFVSSRQRRSGVGGALVEAAFARARSDGYRRMRLDTAKFLAAARRLYLRYGFEETEPSDGVPAEAREVAVFMQRSL